MSLGPLALYASILPLPLPSFHPPSPADAN
jgi:hypothetical protein